MPEGALAEVISEEAGPRSTDVTAVWGAALSAVHCSQCGMAHLVAADAPASLCPVCYREPVVPQPAYLRDEPPEQILPYSISDRHLAGLLDRWASGIWFRPAEMRAEVLARRARRYLIPLWLVDGRVRGPWQADVGFDYQVVSYQDRYSEAGGWRSQEVQETRVRWEPRVGSLDRTYENVVTPALDDHREMMDRLGRFDLDGREGYAPGAVEDSIVRIPTLEPAAAWPQAESAFVRSAEADCRLAAGADHIRDFAIEAAYEGLNWTQLLLPAYATWYREGEQVWPVLINGQSGQVSGVRQASARNAGRASLGLGAAALLLFAVGALFALLGLAVPLVAILGTVLLFVGVVLALAAPIPAISVWIFNRRNSPSYER